MMGLPDFRKLSFSTKILALLVIGNLLGSVLYSISTMASHRESLLRSIDRNLLRAAFAATFIVGREFHERVFSENVPTPEEQDKVCLLLLELAREMDVKYLYSLIEQDGKFFFTSGNDLATASTHTAVGSGRQDVGSETRASGAAPRGQPGGTGPEPFLTEYMGKSAHLAAAFRRKEIFFEETDDFYGSLRSVLLPQTTSSGRVFVIGADVEVPLINRRLMEMSFRYAFQGLVFFLLPFLLVFFLLRQASGHLRRLSAFTKTWIESDFGAVPEIIEGLGRIAETHQDEIGAVSESLLNMHRSLEHHVSELRKSTAMREKIDSEIRIARHIQRSILPKRFPPHVDSDLVRVFAHLQPARGVGGDFFDFAFPSETRMLILVGDVSGKGIPASFFMARATTLLKTYGRQGLAPSEILARTNQDLFRDNDLGMFVTVFCGILDTSSGALEFALAGHNPPFILRSRGLEELPAGGIPLGAVTQPVFGTGSTRLEEGDFLLLFTDGVTEALNPQKELFGETRLRRCLETFDRTSTPDALVGKVCGEVAGFAVGSSQEDDIMVMAVRFSPDMNEENRAGFQNIRIQNSTRELPRVYDFLGRIFHGTLFPASSFEEIPVVIEECLSNVIRHAFPADEPHEIVLHSGIVGGAFLAVIEDDGAPFDPLAKRKVILDSVLEEREIGGLGIHLVKRLSDSVDYERRNGKNLLRIKKFLGQGDNLEQALQEGKPMEITEKFVDSIAVLGLSGRLDTDTSPVLEQKLTGLADKGFLRMILDLSHLEFITSGGLRILLQVSRRVQPQQGRLMLVGMPDNIRKIFQLTGFLNIYTNYPSQEDALAVFRADASK